MIKIMFALHDRLQLSMLAPEGDTYLRYLPLLSLFSAKNPEQKPTDALQFGTNNTFHSWKIT